MQQYLIVGIGGFGGAVIDRVRALPVERNVVYHRLECPPATPVSAAYLTFRKRLLDVLNREVYNFANTQLTVYLVGLLVEEHMAENLMHLGYLFKTLFRENIILNPRVKVLTALPTIIPEEAYAWLPRTRRTLEEIDSYAALKAQFRPAYPDLKRPLPAISGPPWEEAFFCYSESLDAEDVEVSAQAAATKIYFDLALLSERTSADAGIVGFYRSFPAGQGFAPVSGCAVAFLPSLTKLVRDEMEYVLMTRLCDRFLSGEAPEVKVLDKLAEDVLRRAEALRLEGLVDAVVEHALTHERWFDLASIDALSKYDIEISSPPDTYLLGFLTSLERERTRFAERMRELAVGLLARLPERVLDGIKADLPHLTLRELDALFTHAFFRVLRLLDQRPSVVKECRGQWEKARGRVNEAIAHLKEIAGAKDARMKHGSETDARIKGVLGTLRTRDLLRQCLSVTVAEAVAEDETLEARLREAYDKIHALLVSFLERRGEVMTYLYDRRDAYLKRREMYLYVFNQVFRRRVLDAEIDKRMGDLEKAMPGDALARAAGAFFFKKWASNPKLAMEEVEAALMEAVEREARGHVEQAASEVQVDYGEVARILWEIADSQANSIFDMKYKEHPQAAYKQAMFLFHKDEKLKEALPQGTREGIDLMDVAFVGDLPFQVLQVMEIYNLPFRALRQYASLDREPEGN